MGDLLPSDAVPSGTKGRILTSALQVFARQGFAGSSIREIAAPIGINPATLYAHFASKEAILLALIQIGGGELLRRVEKAVDGVTDAEARLERLLAATATAHAAHPMLAIVTNAQVPSLPEEALASATSASATVAAMLRATLRAGEEAGVFDVLDPEFTARAFEAIVQRIPTWVLGSSDSPTDIVSACVSLSRRMVGLHG